jgi:hypothetical protein
LCNDDDDDDDGDDDDDLKINKLLLQLGQFELLPKIENISHPIKIKTTPSIAASQQRIAIDYDMSKSVIETLEKDLTSNRSTVLNNEEYLSSLNVCIHPLINYQSL